MLVVWVIFKAFALTGRKVDCWFTQGEWGQTCGSSDLHLSPSLLLSFLIFHRKERLKRQKIAKLSICFEFQVVVAAVGFSWQ